jgi:hypothetical protein
VARLLSSRERAEISFFPPTSQTKAEETRCKSVKIMAMFYPPPKTQKNLGFNQECTIRESLVNHQNAKSKMSNNVRIESIGKKIPQRAI